MTNNLSHLAAQSPNVEVPAARLTRLLDAYDNASLDAFGDFSLRMASHGLSISSGMMRRDPDYALEQLRHALSLPDEALRQLAACMERDFNHLVHA